MALLLEHWCFLWLWYIGLQRTSPRGIVSNQQSNLESIPCVGYALLASWCITHGHPYERQSSLWQPGVAFRLQQDQNSHLCVVAYHFKNIFQDIMYILLLMGIISMWNAAMPLALPVWKLCPELDTSKCIIVDDYYWPVLFVADAFESSLPTKVFLWFKG